MRFRKQLFAGLGALVALITTMAAIGILALHATSADEGALAREYADDLAVVERLRFLAEHLVATSRGYLLSGDGSLRDQFDDGKREIEDALRDLQGRHPGSARIAAIDRATRDYIGVATNALEQREVVGHPDQILPMFETTLVPHRKELDAELASMAHDRRESFEQALRGSQSVARSAQFALVLSSILAIACGLTLAFLVSGRLSRQFRDVELATAVATRAAGAREELLAVVSHDLRNPLHAITLAATLARDTTREAATQKYARTIHNAAERMQHMIDELLVAAKLENGRVDVKCEPTEIRELIDATLDLFHARAQDRGIVLTRDNTEGRVLADRERAIEVLSNLLGNAFKFTPPGGHVAVRVENIGDSVRFSVADDGPGIAQHQLPRLFERYWQGDRRKEAEGLGLGLFICKRLVEAHHGTIGVDSRLGEGATFWFTLPAIGTRRAAEKV